MKPKSKWAFQRLVNELSSEQYERMIAVLREANIPLPGWTDRLAPDSNRILPAEAIRVLAPLEALLRAIALARTARWGNLSSSPMEAVWLQASAGRLRVCGSDDYAAAYMDVDTTVDVPGTVVVDSRDLWQITEALRKSIPSAQRMDALVSLESDGHNHLRIGLGDRSHRAKLLPRHARAPSLPPHPTTVIRLADGAAFRRAVLHVVSAADYDARCSESTDFGYVGLCKTVDTLTIDAQRHGIAAQANLPVDHAARIDLLVNYCGSEMSPLRSVRDRSKSDM